MLMCLFIYYKDATASIVLSLLDLCDAGKYISKFNLLVATSLLFLTTIVLLKD